MVGVGGGRGGRLAKAEVEVGPRCEAGLDLGAVGRFAGWQGSACCGVGKVQVGVGVHARGSTKHGTEWRPCLLLCCTPQERESRRAALKAEAASAFISAEGGSGGGAGGGSVAADDAREEPVIPRVGAAGRRGP